VIALLLARAVLAPPRSLPDCLGRAQVRPASVVLTCADASFSVRKLRWTGWGRPTARATGTAYANDCRRCGRRRASTCRKGATRTYGSRSQRASSSARIAS
jgi:hypothetical protein